MVQFCQASTKLYFKKSLEKDPFEKKNFLHIKNRHVNFGDNFFRLLSCVPCGVNSQTKQCAFREWKLLVYSCPSFISCRI